MTDKVGKIQRYRGYVIMRGYVNYYILREGQHIGTTDTYTEAVEAIDGIWAALAAA